MSWSGGTFTRTNGVYSGATVWFSDYSANVKIVYDRHDYHDQDLAQGINACINKNGQNSPTANIDWGGFKITGLSAGASSTDSARYGQTITAAAIDPSSKILTLTRADGNVTVDLTPIVVAGDTSDFARLSLGQTFAGQNTFTSLVQLQGSATWFGSNVAGFASTAQACSRPTSAACVCFARATLHLGFPHRRTRRSPATGHSPDRRWSSRHPAFSPETDTRGP
jgi:hypothetical protein